MGILPSYNCVNTTVSLYHLDFNEILEEKARGQLHKDVGCCFKQILEATPYKSTAVQPFTSHLTNHSRHAGHCWRSKDEFISNVFLWTPTHGHTSIGQPVKSYIHQLCRH